MCKAGCNDCGDCKARVQGAMRRARLRGKLKPTHGVKKEGGAYHVVANSGRNEGVFASKAAAARRVREIEYFKHHGS